MTSNCKYSDLSFINSLSVTEPIAYTLNWSLQVAIHGEDAIDAGRKACHWHMKCTPQKLGMIASCLPHGVLVGGCDEKSRT